VSVRAEQYVAEVIGREQLSPHLVRVVLDVATFASTGIPDEWVGLVVPGQFQSRYYTVRAYEGGRLTLDVVVHETGLVTEWAAREEIVGETVTITEPKGSFELPPGARWLMLVGDLTALPAMARIAAEADLPVSIWADYDEAHHD
jgi:NADPH-dependent ferric siderophore reductase